MVETVAMDFSVLLQIVVVGIAAGGVYGLIALGFVLIYKATSILNLAMGEFMTLGAFVCFTALASFHLPFYLAFIITIVFAVLLGVVIEPLILRPMIGEPVISVVMVTIGLGVILKGLTYMIWGPVYRAFPPIFPSKPLLLGPVVVPSGLLWGFLFAIATMAVFIMIFKFSRTGVAMRAAAFDQQAALSMGVSVRKVFALSWSFGAIAAVISGIVIGNMSGLNIYMGDIGLAVLSVIILGGLDSIGGAILGGFIVGILQNLTGFYIDPLVGGGAKDIAPYVILLLIIMIRPYGLFGKVTIERV